MPYISKLHLSSSSCDTCDNKNPWELKQIVNKHRTHCGRSLGSAAAHWDNLTCKNKEDGLVSRLVIKWKIV